MSTGTIDFTQPWLVLPDTLRELVAARHLFARAGAGAEEQMAAAFSRNDRDQGGQQAGRVAVLPIQGLITPGDGGLMAMLFGGTGLNGLAQALETATASADVDAIVLNVDSPGGYASLVQETAEMIREAGATKPIVASVNTTAGSAAYWLASQAHEIVATPSGYAGSIGAYRPHVDYSVADERDGIKTTLISAGKFKTEGNPYEPLSDEALAAIQSEIDELYDRFVDDVALGRGTTAASVKTGHAQGRMLGAHRALEAGLVDRIGTLTDAVALAASGDLTPLRSARADATSSPRGGDAPELDRDARLALAAVLA